MKKVLCVAGIVVLLLWATGAIFPAHRGWRSGAAVPQRSVCVSSLNMDMQTDVHRLTKEIFGYPVLNSCDVLLLQEVVRSGKVSAAEEFAAATGRHVVFASPVPGDTLSGLAILSKYPIRDVESLRLKEFDFVFRARKRLALLATVDTPAGAVRIANTHLDTRINAKSRVEQLTPLVVREDLFQGPRVIGGDLNTNNNGWIGHLVPLPFTQVQTGAVRDLMAEHGFATPFWHTGPTHKMLGMRLDWIYAKQLLAVDAGVETIPFSDHNAIWARFGVE